MQLHVDQVGDQGGNAGDQGGVARHQGGDSVQLNFDQHIVRLRTLED